MSSPRPAPTIESLCREVQQQLLLVCELQPSREVLQIPRAWLESWYNDLARVIVLWLSEE